MPFLRQLQPLLAAALAACLLLVSLAAWSPELHERLHALSGCEAEMHENDAPHAGHDGSDHEHSTAEQGSNHSCAVTLFASGCDKPAFFTLAQPVKMHAEGVASFTELLLARTLRGPKHVCGPPALA